MAIKKDFAREDYMTNRILAVFTYAFALVMGLMVVYRGYTNVETFVATYSTMWVVFFTALGATALLGILAILRFLKHGSELRVFSLKNCALGAAMLTVCAFFAANYKVEGVTLMYVFIPAVSALLLVYFLYPADFFGMAAVLGCCAAVTWYFSRATGAGFIWERGIKAGKPLYFAIAAVVLLVAYTIANVRLSKNKGVLKTKNGAITIYPKTAKYRLAHISALLTFIVVAIGYICGGSVAFYLVYAVIGYLFILVVYYTVKLL